MVVLAAVFDVADAIHPAILGGVHRHGERGRAHIAGDVGGHGQLLARFGAHARGRARAGEQHACGVATASAEAEAATESQSFITLKSEVSSLSGGS